MLEILCETFRFILHLHFNFDPKRLAQCRLQLVILPDIQTTINEDKTASLFTFILIFFSLSEMLSKQTGHRSAAASLGQLNDSQSLLRTGHSP